MMEKSIYRKMLVAGVEIDNHETDLYVPVTDVTTAILNDYHYRSNVKPFRSNIDGTQWYDIPFAYDPAWIRKQYGGESVDALPYVIRPLAAAYTRAEILALPVLFSGHFANCVIYTPTFRVFVTRMLPDDYGDAPKPPDYPIDYETLTADCWRSCDRNGKPL
jgi:hypothetical protein